MKSSKYPKINENSANNLLTGIFEFLKGLVNRPITSRRNKFAKSGSFGLIDQPENPSTLFEESSMADSDESHSISVQSSNYF